MEILKIKKLHPDAHIPTRAHSTDAGMDLYALPVEYTDEEKHAFKLAVLAGLYDDFDYHKQIRIPAHETVMIHTGIAVEIPIGYMGAVYARSGLASKKSLAPVNGVGIIDSEYRGELMVPLHNHSNQAKLIDVGDRIAQLVIQPISLCTPMEVEELDETDRGVGGFGSSGAK